VTRQGINLRHGNKQGAPEAPPEAAELLNRKIPKDCLRQRERKLRKNALKSPVLPLLNAFGIRVVIDLSFKPVIVRIIQDAEFIDRIHVQQPNSLVIALVRSLGRP